ncbi:hypothetical protein [Francisella marina]|uniref:Uncharacterized protein n=1 Tax=Francisella marina TaxID=2249302 RepID=A0ABX5ZHT0_9GAMM|nr:hypothetical protein [Francisella marina]QEO57554.1 hypothetical protein F0R74_06700 [Francisella marina]
MIALILSIFLVMIIYYSLRKINKKNNIVNIKSNGIEAIGESYLINRRRQTVKNMSKEIREKLNKFPSENISVVAKETGFFKVKLPNKMNGVKKTNGVLLTVDEKKNLGLNTRERYGWDYINMLTKKGLKNADKALRLVYINSMHRKYRKDTFKDLSLFNSDKDRFTISTNNECKKCSNIKNNKYKLEELPIFPLSGCDQECQCSYKIYIED